jgi:hypothetical protein
VCVAGLTIALPGCATREPSPTADEQLAQRVKHALNTQPVYNYPHVGVQTYRGVVRLTGEVANESQKDLAGEILRNVRGVTAVENTIVVPLDRERVRSLEPAAERAPSNHDAGRPIGGVPDVNSTTTGAGAEPPP